jgi:hypothetical protein
LVCVCVFLFVFVCLEKVFWFGRSRADVWAREEGARARWAVGCGVVFQDEMKVEVEVEIEVEAD